MNRFYQTVDGGLGLNLSSLSVGTISSDALTISTYDLDGDGDIDVADKLKIYEKEIAKTGQDVGSLQDSIQAIDSEIQNMDIDYQNLQATVSTLDNKQQQINNDVEELALKADTNENSIDELEPIVSDNKLKIETCESNLEGLVSSFNTTTTALESENTNQNGQITSILQDNTSQGSRIADCENDINSMQETQDDIQIQLGDLPTDGSSTVSGRLTTNEEEMVLARELIRQKVNTVYYNSEMNKYKDANDQQDIRLDDYKTRIIANEQSAVDHETRITANEQIAADHETRITANKQSVVDHETRVTSNEQSLVDHETRITSNEQSAVDHETRVTANEQSLADHETRIQNTETELSNIEITPTEVKLGDSVLQLGNSNLYSAEMSLTSGIPSIQFKHTGNGDLPITSLSLYRDFIKFGIRDGTGQIINIDLMTDIVDKLDVADRRSTAVENIMESTLNTNLAYNKIDEIEDNISNHDHDNTYAPFNHSHPHEHSEYSLKTHTHATNPQVETNRIAIMDKAPTHSHPYASDTHTHDFTYSKLNHSHDVDPQINLNKNAITQLQEKDGQIITDVQTNVALLNTVVEELTTNTDIDLGQAESLTTLGSTLSSQAIQIESNTNKIETKADVHDHPYADVTHTHSELITLQDALVSKADASTFEGFNRISSSTLDFNTDSETTIRAQKFENADNTSPDSHSYYTRYFNHKLYTYRKYFGQHYRICIWDWTKLPIYYTSGTTIFDLNVLLPQIDTNTAALTGKADSEHTHSEFTELQTALDGKAPTHSHPYALTDHTHDLTGKSDTDHTHDLLSKFTVVDDTRIDLTQSAKAYKQFGAQKLLVKDYNPSRSGYFWEMKKLPIDYGMNSLVFTVFTNGVFKSYMTMDPGKLPYFNLSNGTTVYLDTEVAQIATNKNAITTLADDTTALKTLTTDMTRDGDRLEFYRSGATLEIRAPAITIASQGSPDSYGWKFVYDGGKMWLKRNQGGVWYNYIHFLYNSLPTFYKGSTPYSLQTISDKGVSNTNRITTLESHNHDSDYAAKSIELTANNAMNKATSNETKLNTIPFHVKGNMMFQSNWSGHFWYGDPDYGKQVQSMWITCPRTTTIKKILYHTSGSSTLLSTFKVRFYKQNGDTYSESTCSKYPTAMGISSMSGLTYERGVQAVIQLTLDSPITLDAMTPYRLNGYCESESAIGFTEIFGDQVL